MEYPHRVRVVAGIVVVLVIALAAIAIFNPRVAAPLPSDLAQDVVRPLTQCEKVTSRQSPTIGDRVALPLSCDLAPGSTLSGWKVNVLSQTSDQSKILIKLEDTQSGKSQTITLGPKAEKDAGTNYFWDGYVNFAYDVNQDGYKDLRVVSSLEGTNVFYDYWIFNPSKLVYEKSSDLKSIPNAYYNSQTKTVNGAIATGNTTLTEIRFFFVDGYFARSEAKRVRN